LVAKATGNTAGIPTIAFDLSAMKNGIIGSSGERLRSALSIIDAVSGGRSLWLATCNSIGSLPPELRRRFTLGTFFFDLPAADEREAIWQIYTSKYGVQDERPHDDNWTGAEIKECCRKAYRLRMSLRQSAEYLVPVARSAADQIESLRQQSSGKYLSASHPGVYEYNRNAATPKGRAFRTLERE
jgi:SpoVK/Ycf46/Vps4 family AAA+-type ATPase